mmetsp:Transcript_13789/g.32181  ORF Transcript_13789/g.32181 Transcript_13789/m.32181 type:complete len:213 (-) Transcript_13789:181-819(-)
MEIVIVAVHCLVFLSFLVFIKVLVGTAPTPVGTVIFVILANVFFVAYLVVAIIFRVGKLVFVTVYVVFHLVLIVVIVPGIPRTIPSRIDPHLRLFISKSSVIDLVVIIVVLLRSMLLSWSSPLSFGGGIDIPASLLRAIAARTDATGADGIVIAVVVVAVAHASGVLFLFSFLLFPVSRRKRSSACFLKRLFQGQAKRTHDVCCSCFYLELE